MLNRHLTEAHNVYQNQFYSILTEKIAADLSSDTFESVRSTLVFNLAKWPLGALDPLTDNSEYSCQSTSSCVHTEGEGEDEGDSRVDCEGVSSSTQFTVHFPPR